MSEGEDSSGTSGKKLIPQNCTTQLRTLRKDFRLLLTHVVSFILKQESSPELREKGKTLNSLLRSHTAVLIRDLVRIEARIRQERQRVRKKSKQAKETAKNNETKKEIDDFMKRLKTRLDPALESEPSKKSF